MVLKLEKYPVVVVSKFENDVKMYGTETESALKNMQTSFENDVKTYGTETCSHEMSVCFCLRMM